MVSQYRNSVKVSLTEHQPDDDVDGDGLLSLSRSIMKPVNWMLNDQLYSLHHLHFGTALIRWKNQAGEKKYDIVRGLSNFSCLG